MKLPNIHHSQWIYLHCYVAHVCACNNMTESERHCTLKGTRQNCTSCMIPLIWPLWTDKPNAWLQNSEQWLPGVGRTGTGTVRDTESGEEGNGSVLYLHSDASYMVYMYLLKFTELCVSNRCILLYIKNLKVYLKKLELVGCYFCYAYNFSSYFYPQNHQLQSPWITSENKVWLDYT